ncbi:3-oxoacyl-ACP synthase [Aquimarina sp. BL5]|uniref:3-oxoacyl-ACP synthase n=1 Tax=Aquimarina sp. BL5 TaxID=1714860 RepID=UPI000E4B3651|nr:3-oxoacyl-ACP synthase [Aquimarina sp. BL5]AXT52145.1 3-oxoacyl-ACP synthase [Aquimarina sp. BL5]RKN10801.1 3-oxoacyl-ACP synthase [Aquimarina sp. BL5]
MKKIKEELYDHCKQFIQDRHNRIQNRIANIQESLTSETKSTAGDKHETGRAMLQLEREKAGAQLAEVQKLQEVLAKIDTHSSSQVIRLGNIVKTSKGNYYLSISVGEISINNNSYFAIATNTPIGKLLLGKTTGEKFRFNNTLIEIIDIS